MDLIDSLPGPITVLGGGGFIGSNLVKRLVDGGRDDVLVIDVHVPDFRRSALQGATVCEIDARRVGLDGTVFHLAADMGGVGWFHGPADLGAALTNGDITNHVLTLAPEAQRIFYASSACAYPTELMRPGGPALVEDQVGMGTPDALYGAEKLQGLRLCSKIPHARVGLLDTVYGPLQEHEGRRMKFPAAVATKAIRSARTGEPLELWGDGSQLRTYCYIDDAIDQILAVTASPDYWGPVNVGASKQISCRSVAMTCLDILGADVPVVTNPAEPTGVTARHCSREKYEAHYGPSPDRSYREGFELFIDWLQGVV